MTPSSDRLYSIVFLIAMLAGAAWLLFSMMEPFIEPIFVAFVLAVAFAPLHSRLQGRIRNKPIAAVLTTLLVITLVVGPLIGLVVVFAQQGMGAYQTLSRSSAADGGWSSWAQHLIEGPVQWASAKTGVSPPRIQQVVADSIQRVSQRLIAWSGSFATNLGTTLSRGVIVFFTLFFFFLEGSAIKRGFLDWLPIERHRAEQLLAVTIQTINANLYGVVAVCAAQGALAAIGFLISGLGSWLFWGVLAAFASLIPMVGAALIWVPVALQLLLTGSWGKALFLALWGVFVVGMADNVIRPWVVSGRTSMSALTVFFALLGGLNAFGLIGLIAGPLVFTLVMTLYRIIEEIRLGKDSAADPATS